MTRKSYIRREDSHFVLDQLDILFYIFFGYWWQ